MVGREGGTEPRAPNITVSYVMNKTERFGGTESYNLESDRSTLDPTRSSPRFGFKSNPDTHALICEP